MKPRELIEALEKMEHEATNWDVRIRSRDMQARYCVGEVDNVILTPRGLELTMRKEANENGRSI